MKKCLLQLQHAINSNSLKMRCAPELVDIILLEQGVWGHIYSLSETIDILVSSIFAVLYANNYI